jgi:hypothetical protein
VRVTPWSLHRLPCRRAQPLLDRLRAPQQRRALRLLTTRTLPVRSSCSQIPCPLNIENVRCSSTPAAPVSFVPRTSIVVADGLHSLVTVVIGCECCRPRRGCSVAAQLALFVLVLSTVVAGFVLLYSNTPVSDARFAIGTVLALGLGACVLGCLCFALADAVRACAEALTTRVRAWDDSERAARDQTGPGLVREATALPAQIVAIVMEFDAPD